MRDVAQILGVAASPADLGRVSDAVSAVLGHWTGAQARALRLARRMSVRQFADYLGVSARIVSKWEAGGRAISPRPVNQAALDTSLHRASPHVLARFLNSHGDTPDAP